MSRSGYVEDGDDPWMFAMWRGAVASAIRGKRGQKLLRDLLAALDAMPEKKLIENHLERQDGCVCALGALGKERGIEMDQIDPNDSDLVAMSFDVARALACEIVWVNDEAGALGETPERRWTRVRAWVAKRINNNTGAAA